MRIHILRGSVAVVILACAGSARAQSDATGHWKGSVQVQSMRVDFVVDIAKNGRGELAGTIGLPSQQIKGLPLQKITVEGSNLTFYAREDQPFRGALGGDGTIAGDMSIEGLSAPFTMTRTGEGVLEPVPRSTGVDKALAGRWTGALEAGGKRLRLILQVDLQPDGSMIADMTDVDEGGLRSPVKITQQGPTVTIESLAVPAVISGSVDSAATELIGMFKQGSASLPVTLRREVASKHE